MTRWVARLVHIGAPIILGAITALGHAPFGWALLSFVALSGAYFLAYQNRAGFFWGWCYGAGYFGLSLSWIAEPFLVDPQTVWMAPFGVAAMAGGLALFWGGAFWAAKWLSPAQAALSYPIALAVTMSGFEYARGHVLSGFPWAHISYIWEDTAVAQLVALGGIYSLGLLTFLVASVPAIFHKAQLPMPRKSLVVLALCLIAASNLTSQRVGDVPQRSVRLVQPNALQHQKWDPDHYSTFYERALAYTAAPSDVPLSAVIWPEMSYAPHYSKNEVPFARIAQAAGGVPVIVGYPQWSETGQPYNALALIGASGQVEATYHKFHLVPFGEFIPWRTVLAPLDVFGLTGFGGDFSAGKGAQTITIEGLGRVQPLICYEAVFPQHILRGALRPDYIIHMTNDAWFGRFSGPYQHLAQARFRAIESGVPVIRVGNTGISAVIDPKGRVLDPLALGTDGYVDVAVPAAFAPTFYNQWGDLPFIVILIFGLIALIVWRQRMLDQ